jgi:hypothetical protein
MPRRPGSRASAPPLLAVAPGDAEQQSSSPYPLGGPGAVVGAIQNNRIEDVLGRELREAACPEATDPHRNDGPRPLCTHPEAGGDGQPAHLLLRPRPFVAYLYVFAG